MICDHDYHFPLVWYCVEGINSPAVGFAVKKNRFELAHVRRVCTALVASYLQDAVYAIDGAHMCSKLPIDFIFVHPEGIFSGISLSRLCIGQEFGDFVFYASKHLWH